MGLFLFYSSSRYLDWEVLAEYKHHAARKKLQRFFLCLLSWGGKYKPPWGKLDVFVCLSVTEEILFQSHGGLRSRELGQAPKLLVFLIPWQALSSHLRQQWSDCIGYRIEIQVVAAVTLPPSHPPPP